MDVAPAGIVRQADHWNIIGLLGSFQTTVKI